MDGDVDDRNAAKRPSQFGWSDWKRILLRVKDEVGRDNLSIIAAGVAFYAMLAVFPALAALVGLYGLIADPAEIAEHMQAMRALLPEEAFAIIQTQLDELISAQKSTLGLASVIGLLFAVWSARAGTNALITGLSIVYDEKEQRGFFSQVVTSLTLTALLIGVVIVALIAVVVIPPLLDLVSFGLLGEWFASLARWPIAFLAVMVGLGALYRYGPHRSRAKMAWVSWGAAIATLLWIFASALFSIYVANFANYNETYGSIGAVIGMLMWFYVSAWVVLLGAELNAEMEHQTPRDTTVGKPQPMGERGAYVADNWAGDGAGS